MSAAAPEVQGRCEPSFESLRQALADVMDTGSEVGAALAVHVGKQPVVDLWAGHRDSARTQLWDENTIVNLAPSDTSAPAARLGSPIPMLTSPSHTP